MANAATRPPVRSLPCAVNAAAAAVAKLLVRARCAQPRPPRCVPTVKGRRRQAEQMYVGDHAGMARIARCVLYPLWTRCVHRVRMVAKHKTRRSELEENRRACRQDKPTTPLTSQHRGEAAVDAAWGPHPPNTTARVYTTQHNNTQARDACARCRLPSRPQQCACIPPPYHLATHASPTAVRRAQRPSPGRTGCAGRGPQYPHPPPPTKTNHPPTPNPPNPTPATTWKGERPDVEKGPHEAVVSYRPPQTNTPPKNLLPQPDIAHVSCRVMCGHCSGPCPERIDRPGVGAERASPARVAPKHNHQPPTTHPYRDRGMEDTKQANPPRLPHDTMQTTDAGGAAVWAPRPCSERLPDREDSGRAGDLSAPADIG